MSDNKSKQDVRDDIRIDRNDPSEVAYAARECGCSSQDVIAAIEATGTDLRENVYAYLKGKR